MNIEQYKRIKPLLDSFKTGANSLFYATEEWRKGNRSKDIKEILLMFMGEDELDAIR